MKIKAIINPEAGIQKKQLKEITNKVIRKNKKIEDEIKEFFEKNNCEIKIEKTSKKKDAEKIARKSTNYDLIIIVGGDGTINEVINGMKNYETKLGIIPTGSENVTAKELKIPMKTKNALKTILKGKTKKIDIGQANKKKFIFVCGIGFDAHAITKIKPVLKKLLGKHAYTIAGIKTLFEQKAEKITIEYEKEKKEGYFLIISNVKRYGSNLQITPDAKIDDGLLDVCLFKEKNVWNMMRYVLGAASHRMKKIKNLEHFKIRNAKIKTNNPTLYHVDAEIGGTTPVKIKVLKKKLKVIVE